MSKPRVCMLIDLFYPVLDGTGLQALRLARQLTEKQFPVMVVARRSEKHFFPKEHLDDILIYRLLPAGRRTHRVVLLQMVPVVWFLLRHHRKYDLVHVHEARSLLVCALVVRLLFRKPVMALVPTYGDVSRQASQSTRISTYSKILRRFLLPQRLWRALLRQVDVWVALSSEIEDELGQLGLGEKVRRIPNGIDLSLFHPSTPEEKRTLRQHLGLSPDQFYLVSHGRLAKRKRLEVLLEAVALLAPDYPTLELLLPGGLGEAGVKEMLDTLIIEHHLQGRVHFYGMVENVYDYLRAADLFVMPSEREGLPNALLEALNCGLPAVATQIGGIMDVIQNHRGGILVPVGDVEALAAAIRQLMNDPETRRKQGETAAQIGVAYDFRGMTDRYIAAYDDMAKTPPRKVGQ